MPTSFFLGKYLGNKKERFGDRLDRYDSEHNFETRVVICTSLVLEISSARMSVYGSKVMKLLFKLLFAGFLVVIQTR